MPFKKNNYNQALKNQTTPSPVSTSSNPVSTSSNVSSLQLTPKRIKEMKLFFDSMSPQEQEALKREVNYRKQKKEMARLQGLREAKIKEDNEKIKKVKAQEYKESEEIRKAKIAKAKSEAEEKATPTNVDSYLTKVYSFDDDIFGIDNSLAEMEEDFNMAKIRYDNSVSKGRENNTFKLDYEMSKRERDNALKVRSRIALRRQALLRQLGQEVASKATSNEDFVRRLQDQGVPNDIIREIMGILNAK